VTFRFVLVLVLQNTSRPCFTPAYFTSFSFTSLLNLGCSLIYCPLAGLYAFIQVFYRIENIVLNLQLLNLFALTISGTQLGRKRETCLVYSFHCVCLDVCGNLLYYFVIKLSHIHLTLNAEVTTSLLQTRDSRFLCYVIDKHCQVK